MLPKRGETILSIDLSYNGGGSGKGPGLPQIGAADKPRAFRIMR